MKFRSIIFWSHLVTGVAAGLVILMMSVTGVLLTYERQMIASAEEDLVNVSESYKVDLDEMASIARQNVDGAQEIELSSNWNAPVRVYAGRQKYLLDPTESNVIGPVETDTEAFFNTIVRIHRWFGMTGDDRATGKAITGASNLMFIFLALSGAYLWLPPALRWAAFKTRLVFRRSYNSGHARDYNWHHVFSVWMLIPIFVMATTATVFSYRWAHELVYTAYGEEPPQRGRRSAPEAASRPTTPVAGAVSLQDRFIAATSAYPDWQFISLPADASLNEPTVFEVDTGNGAQYHLKHEVTISPNGDVTKIHHPFEDRTPAGQARVTIRFLHTGEVLGFWGQTLAGIGSLAAIFLVWSGLALSYRRLIRPLFRKKP